MTVVWSKYLDPHGPTFPNCFDIELAGKVVFIYSAEDNLRIGLLQLLKACQWLQLAPRFIFPSPSS